MILSNTSCFRGLDIDVCVCVCACVCLRVCALPVVACIDVSMPLDGWIATLVCWITDFFKKLWSISSLTQTDRQTYRRTDMYARIRARELVCARIKQLWLNG